MMVNHHSLKKMFSFGLSPEVVLHENDEEDDALEAQVLAEGVDEEVDQQEGVLHEQHGPVPGQGQLHHGWLGVPTGLVWNGISG